ncbi:MAG: hypothetical protein CSB55_09125 [Candidatus Cloacimonadota bacterium]|nr:MAG: hypothetical protein CSB55_09125 [Candidatus Cloacimonadota bacterium]
MNKPLVFTDFDKIPDASGCFVFKENKKSLYAGFTASIKQALDWLNRKKESEIHVKDLFSRADAFHLFEFKTMFEALVHYKTILREDNTEFNALIRPYEQYQYLSLKFDEPPFIKTSDATADDAFHIGPFYSRFFIFDYSDIVGNRYNLPNCYGDTEEKRLSEEKFSDLSRAEKISVFNRYYLEENHDWIEDLKDENEECLNNLLFEKSEKIKTELRIAEKYRDFIAFLKITKYLNGAINTGEIKAEIKNGLLYSVNYKGKFIEFGKEKDFEKEYRKNEALAVDKSELNERRIIYLTIKENQPEYIKKLTEMKNNL